jgi:hypothetical protein
VQIWDAEANPIGSGGLFNNEKGASKPTEKADRPVGEWNGFRVTMIGERVTVYLNDKRVVDDTVLENYWEGKADLRAGQISSGSATCGSGTSSFAIPRETASRPSPTSRGRGIPFQRRDSRG